MVVCNIMSYYIILIVIIVSLWTNSWWLNLISLYLTHFRCCEMNIHHLQKVWLRPPTEVQEGAWGKVQQVWLHRPADMLHHQRPPARLVVWGFDRLMDVQLLVFSDYHGVLQVVLDCLSMTFCLKIYLSHGFPCYPPSFDDIRIYLYPYLSESIIIFP